MIAVVRPSSHIFPNVCLFFSVLFFVIKIHAIAKITFVPNDADDAFYPSIVGGDEIDPPFAFPWIVSLQHANEHFCSGALIADEWVLTAAHCTQLRIPLAEISVHANRHDLDASIDDEEAQVFRVVKQIDHPRFSFESLRHDISLWLVKPAARQKPPSSTEVDQPSHNDLSTGSFVHDIEPVELSNEPSDYVGWLAIVAGWGGDNEAQEFKPRLHKVFVPVLASSMCRYSLGTAVFGEGMLCAGGLSNQDACKGDSGGPLIVEIEDDKSGEVRHVLIGVVSWGFHCGKLGIPAIYTSVYQHLDWILSIISARQRRFPTASKGKFV